MTIRSTVVTIAGAMAVAIAGCSSDTQDSASDGTAATPPPVEISSTADTSAPDTSTEGVETTDATATATTNATVTVTEVPAPTTSPTLDTSAAFDFAQPASVEAWRSQNDPVMGGVSTGTLAWADGGLVFDGTISLDNGGGFSSIVSPTFGPIGAWTASEGVSIDLVGDGKTYVFQVRTASGNWVQRFDTVEDQPSTVSLRWAAFEPVDRFLGPITSDTPLDPGQIDTLAIYILDKQEGPFRLRLLSIS